MSALLSIVFLGIVVGSLYALAAFGLVLTFRTSGVFNFAQGALGMFGAYLFFQLTQGGKLDFVVTTYRQTWRMPRLPALVLVVCVVAPAFGWLIELVLFRQLRKASGVVQIVATIGLLIAVQGLVAAIWGGATTLTPRSIFPTRRFVAGGLNITIDNIATVVLAFALAAGLVAFLRFSAVGVRMRAVVDRDDLSEIMGVNTHRVSAVAWAVATAFAALSGILIAPNFGSLDPITLSLFVIIVATASAVVGRLESLPITLASAVGIGITQFLIQRYVHNQALARGLRPSIPFLVLFAVLFLPGRWHAAAGGERFQPSPPRAARGRGGIVATAVGAGVLLLFPLAGSSWQPKLLGGAWPNYLAAVPPLAIVFLSLVVLAGYAGQISLCQAALAGFGAFVAAHLVADRHVPFLLAAVLAALLTVPLGAVLASQASRLSALFLGFATLAFGAVMDEVAFTSRSFAGGLQGIAFTRTGFLQGPRAYYFFGLAVFGLLALLATNLRRGRTGLALAAMRDSQTGTASVGADVARLKLVIFCVSAFVAGLGGALLAGAQQSAEPTSFLRFYSLLFLALAVIGGIGSWAGALTGAAMFQLSAVVMQQPFIRDNFVIHSVFHGHLDRLLPVFFGLGAIGLAQNPDGLVAQVRDGAGQLWQFAVGTPDAPAPAEAVAGAGPPAGPEAETAAAGPLAFPHARHYHVAGCVFTTGKAGRPLAARRASSLVPCPVCAPEPPAPRPVRPRRRTATA